MEHEPAPLRSFSEANLSGMIDDFILSVRFLQDCKTENALTEYHQNRLDFLYKELQPYILGGGSVSSESHNLRK